MKSLRFAAIDIGSNAVRLLITSVSPGDPDERQHKLHKIRFPLRLGQESFVSGKISDDKVKQLVRLMIAFKQLMTAYDVNAYRACATAALRNAVNAHEIIAEIKNEAELDIEVIDGQEESFITYRSHFGENTEKEKNQVLVDVGGGSTEISLIVGGALIQSKSYDIGTIRLLTGMVKGTDWDQLHEDLKALRNTYPVPDLIASGGNIIKLNAMVPARKGHRLPLTSLETLYDTLRQQSTAELIERYALKPDRADVITHAAHIYIDVAKSLGVEHFLVPGKRLIDGIIQILWSNWKAENGK